MKNWIVRISVFIPFLIAFSSGCSDQKEGEPNQRDGETFDISKLTPEAKVTYEACRNSEKSPCLANESSYAEMHYRCKSYVAYDFTDKCSVDDRKQYMTCMETWKNKTSGCWHNFNTPFDDCLQYKDISFDCLYSITTSPEDYPDPQYKLEASEIKSKNEVAEAWCDRILNCPVSIYDGDKNECVDKVIETAEFHMILSENDKKLQTDLGLDPERRGKCTDEDVVKAIACDNKYRKTCDFDISKLAKNPRDPSLLEEKNKIDEKQIIESNKANQCLQNEVSKPCLFYMGRISGYNKSSFTPESN